jgi:hypothetical protein
MSAHGKYKYDDTFIKSIVDKYNSASSSAERKAALGSANIRLDNLKRMAANRGWKVIVDPKRSAAGKAGARAVHRRPKLKTRKYHRIKPMKRDKIPPITKHQANRAAVESIKSVLFSLAKLSSLEAKIEQIKEIVNDGN